MRYLAVLILIFVGCRATAQNYPNILNYNLNGTPVHGVKIKTNLPFLHASQMPTITIIGYNYGQSSTMGINISWYIWEEAFYSSTASSFGGWAPQLFLANEDGKVVIFLNHKTYFERFTVSAYAQSMSEVPEWFSGWAAVDEPISGQSKVEVLYKNSFPGKVGIGTNTPDYALDVVGPIRAHQVIVNTQKGADFVFEDSYNLRSLEEVEQFVINNKHLPDIPSAQVMVKEGVDMSKMQVQLLQKIEEMTLYIIELKKENKMQQEEIEKLKCLFSNK